MKKYDVIFVGGGTAGISGAAYLRRLDDEVTIAIIEPSEWHYYQPAWTLVGAGVYKIEKTRKKEANYIPKNSVWIKSEATEIDPVNNEVKLGNGEKIQYKALVITTGVSYQLEKIEGFKEALNTQYASTNYIYKYAPHTWEILKNFKEGKAIFTVPDTPYKCGAAPLKIMFLADEIFRKKGIRDNVEIILFTPKEHLFSIKGFAESINATAQAKNIKTYFLHRLVAIDPETKRATFENIQNGKRLTEEYNFIHLVPPQKPPKVVCDNPDLVEGSEQPFFLNVSRYTLQHKRFENIFGMGDVCGAPFAKSGAAIRKQVGVVIPNILQTLRSHTPTHKYSGYTGCPFIVGYRKVVMAEFLYDGIPTSSFPKWLIDTTKPSYLMWLLKVYFLPWMYWNMMLKGKMVG